MIEFEFKKGESIMKKFLYSVLLFMQFSVLQSTWVVVNVDNQSDTVFMRAARNNNVEIPSISQVLRKPCSKDKLVQLDANALFGSSGRCKIIAQTPSGDQLDISFLGDPRHRVANGRAHYSDVASRNEAAILKQPMMARVFATRGNDASLIGFAGYDDDSDHKFTLRLTGSNGAYKTVLIPVNN